MMEAMHGGQEASRDKALALARAALARKAQDVRLLAVGSVCTFADYFVICHGQSRVHLAAIAEAVLEQYPLTAGGHREGADGSGWILLDYGDVIVHIMLEETRKFYGLERLWGDCEQTPVEEDGTVPGGEGQRQLQSEGH